EKKAVFEKGSKKLVLYIGKAEYELNGEQKKMDTAALLISGRTFVPARYVAEAFDAKVSWDPDIRTVYINTNSKPSGKKEGTKIVAGFEVPLDTNLAAVEEEWGGKTEACFQINLLRADVEGQIEDLRQILLQKCDSSTVDEVIAYVSQKKERKYYLPSKYIYDNKSKRYIWIKESFMEDINVFYCSASYTRSE
ncbi:MAG: copper amine oxidase N-terminal domain-containing protein, partial [Hungateiclostridium thermocellum]|nr:copper amine oxidase N-terminal domain-containing protein [Acetivibrio thermocellus]